MEKLTHSMIKLANHRDDRGLHKEATKVDKVLAALMPTEPTEQDVEAAFRRLPPGLDKDLQMATDLLERTIKRIVAMVEQKFNVEIRYWSESADHLAFDIVDQAPDRDKKKEEIVEALLQDKLGLSSAHIKFQQG